jgi:hypothetical protein
MASRDTSAGRLMIAAIVVLTALLAGLAWWR